MAKSQLGNNAYGRAQAARRRELADVSLRGGSLAHTWGLSCIPSLTGAQYTESIKGDAEHNHAAHEQQQLLARRQHRLLVPFHGVRDLTRRLAGSSIDSRHAPSLPTKEKVRGISAQISKNGDLSQMPAVLRAFAQPHLLHGRPGDRVSDAAPRMMTLKSPSLHS